MFSRSIILANINLLTHRTLIRSYVFSAAATDKMIQKKLAKKAMKSRAENTVNYAELIVVGSDYPPHQLTSLLVRSGHKSYLFNCGEGFQRACANSHIKINHIEHVLLTNNIWPRISGAVGFFLSAQEAGLKDLTIYGSDRIEGFLDAIEPFTPNTKDVNVKERSYKNGLMIDDGGLKIETIPLDGLTTRQPNTLSDSSGEISNVSEPASFKRSKLEQNLLAYYCQLPEMQGKLDIEKCRSLKVPFGPHLASLKAGEDIHLEDGTLIRSEDVVTKSDSGCNFIVIECPTVGNINYVINNKRLKDLQSLRGSDFGENHRIDYVIHFTPEEVHKNFMYQKWMDGFSEDCRHLMLCHNYPKRINFVDIYRHQHALRTLDNVIFPTLYLPENLAKLVEKDPMEKKEVNLNEHLVTESMDSLPRVTYATSYDHYCLRPATKLQYPDRSLDLEYYLDDGRAWSKQLDKTIEELHEAQKGLPEPSDYEPEVVFLGTCSTKPSKTRNVSAILINFTHPTNSSVILDCGEGTYGQLVRLYGPEKAGEILKQLRFIFVSHHHADHHLGLMTLLEHRASLTSDTVPIVVPTDLRLLLDYHSKKYNNIARTFKVYDPASLAISPKKPSEMHKRHLPSHNRLVSEKSGGLVNLIKTVPVDHCVNAYAVVIEFNIGHKAMPRWTVVYSGDCRPSADLVEAGKNCDLLIHEATYDNRENNFALINKHSTSSEAIRVGKDMRAKYTLLTHFSAKSAKIPIFTEQFDDTVGISFDFMTVRCPTQLKRLPLMRPALQNLFKRAVIQVEEAIAKRETNFEKHSYYKI